MLRFRQNKRQQSNLEALPQTGEFYYCSLWFKLRLIFIVLLEDLINSLPQLERSHERYQQEEERLQYRDCVGNKQRREQVGSQSFNKLFFIF